jgi:hypothetical protein
MTEMQPFGVVRIHFTSSKKAMAASVYGSCTAGMRTASGKVKTWIAHVAKVSASETMDQAAKRINNQ